VFRSLKLKTNLMENHLKILHVEYISNQWSDLIQILNLSKRDQTKVYKSFLLKTTPMEDDLEILKVEPLVGSYPNSKLNIRCPNQSLQKT
jgi:hypothetical protein